MVVSRAVIDSEGLRFVAITVIHVGMFSDRCSRLFSQNGRSSWWAKLSDELLVIQIAYLYITRWEEATRLLDNSIISHLFD